MFLAGQAYNSKSRQLGNLAASVEIRKQVICGSMTQRCLDSNSNGHTLDAKKPDLHATLDEYFKLIRKTYKKGAELSFRRNVNLIKDPEFFEGRTVLGFSWKGSIRANGLIFHTGKRITIVQVMGQLKENWAIHSSSHFSVNYGQRGRTADALECLRV